MNEWHILAISEKRVLGRDGQHMCATEQCKMGRDLILYLVGLRYMLDCVGMRGHTGERRFEPCRDGRGTAYVRCAVAKEGNG